MTYPIWNKEIPFYLPDVETPNTFSFFQTKCGAPAPCVIIAPGGGYHFRAGHEGRPFAEFFQANGIHAAVVDYRVAPNRFPSGLADFLRVIRIVRAHSTEWNVDPNRILVCGSSAGGHLAASSAFWQDVYEKTDEIDEQSAIPNGLILCYPVITFCPEWGHVGSGKQLLGDDRYESDYPKFCLSDLVTEKTPPTFLWHTAEDNAVPVRNSLEFAKALSQNRVPFELHIFPHGKHGLGLANDREGIREWPKLALNWIHSL